MHDHGPLPFPREGGEYAQLIGFVCEAKKASDDFLTKVIEAERMSAPNQQVVISTTAKLIRGRDEASGTTTRGQCIPMRM